MINRNNTNIVILIKALLASAAFVFLSVPAFNMTGLIIKPILLCIVGGAAISILLYFTHNGETICGISLLLFVVFWLIYAFAKQFELQLSYAFPGKWIEFFYFDKLLIIGTIWLSSSLFFVIARLLPRNSTRNYRNFFRMSSFSFLIFYTFLLVYSFVFIRLERGEYPMNWVPFNTVREYLSDYSSIPYEVFMMFFGNLLYFTPLGVIFHLVIKKQKPVLKTVLIALFPLLAFSLLEYSQYLLQNGYCEFDDMMMNSVGFWFGSLFGIVADITVKKATKGRLTSFWG